MSKVREKAQGFTKILVGEMIGDDLLVQEGKEQERNAERDSGSPDSPAGKVKPASQRGES